MPVTTGTKVKRRRTANTRLGGDIGSAMADLDWIADRLGYDNRMRCLKRLMPQIRKQIERQVEENGVMEEYQVILREN